MVSESGRHRERGWPTLPAWPWPLGLRLRFDWESWGPSVDRVKMALDRREVEQKDRASLRGL